MLPERSCLLLIAIAVSASSCMLICGCQPERPVGVPADSSYMVGGKETWWWERCFYDSTHNVDRCQSFNKNGLVLEDEVYLPFDGGKPALPSELVIDPGAKLTGPYVICLKNGRILLPQSDFANQMRFVD